MGGGGGRYIGGMLPNRGGRVVGKHTLDAWTELLENPLGVLGGFVKHNPDEMSVRLDEDKGWLASTLLISALLELIFNRGDEKLLKEL